LPALLSSSKPSHRISDEDETLTEDLRNFGALGPECGSRGSVWNASPAALPLAPTLPERKTTRLALAGPDGSQRASEVRCRIGTMNCSVDVAQGPRLELPRSPVVAQLGNAAATQLDGCATGSWKAARILPSGRRQHLSESMPEAHTGERHCCLRSSAAAMTSASRTEPPG
jgi:hypothetical protein